MKVGMLDKILNCTAVKYFMRTSIVYRGGGRGWQQNGSKGVNVLLLGKYPKMPLKYLNIFFSDF
jgi:hypothetical protein